ncbi:hypothetical protein PIB30_012960 [Stylosanthes scabra]|uniref:Uncharacterized protein n=1 Tax=Stylosanthes scabra TaxID=79078 RepID=A0ABU6Z3W9_9FABA|nr:hypothetical protein [Stylosanthes scabra]
MGRDRDGIWFRSSTPVVLQMYRVVTMEELKSVILRNIGLGAVGTTLVRRVAYRLLNIFPPDQFKFKIFWVDSDEHVRALFDLHCRYVTHEVMELLTEMQRMPDVAGGSSSSNGVIPCSPIHCPASEVPMLMDTNSGEDSNEDFVTNFEESSESSDRSEFVNPVPSAKMTFGPKRTKPRNYEYATRKWIYKGRRPNTSAILLHSFTPKREREQPRIDSRVGLNQFFHHSRQLPNAITFDLELRLTHGLRLREALDVLFASIMHASSGYLVLGYSMARRKSRMSIELGVQFLPLLNRFACDRVDSLYQKCFEDSKSLTSESTLFFVESIRLCPESLRTISESILSWLESTRVMFCKPQISLSVLSRF